MPQHAARRNAIIAEHGDAFSRARRLIMDVRGNAGGNATYFPLADYFLAEEIRISTATDILVSESRGNIDYMQVTMLKFGEGGFSYWFGYPLYVKRGLPEKSVDDEGYAPDIRLAPGNDWIAWSKRWLLQATGKE
ncbi:MAG TPA: hypothetical protein VF254_00785 [Gammaproteobacteria bacterium]